MVDVKKKIGGNPKVVFRYWLLVLLISSLIVFFFSNFLPKKYLSESRLVFSKKGVAENIDPARLLDRSRIVTKIAEEKINTLEFNKKVLNYLAVDYSRQDLEDDLIIEAKLVGEEQVLKIATEAEKPTLARKINSRAVKMIVSDPSISSYLDNFDLRSTVIESPNSPKEPLYPNPAKNALFFFLGGLTFSVILLVFIKE